MGIIPIRSNTNVRNLACVSRKSIKRETITA
jgi:hypothetical protein